MTVAVVYSPKERPRVEPFVRVLESRGIPTAMAPLGIEAGTDEWVNITKAAIDSAVACLLFLSQESVVDPWVAKRVEWALDAHCRLCPIWLDDPLPDIGRWVIPESVSRYNAVRCTSSDDVHDVAVRVAFGLLPEVSRTVTCFISYARADSELVDRVDKDLEDNGIKVWRDVDSIRPGRSWDDEIEMALRSCTHVLFVVSAMSTKSAHVADEIAFALDRNKPVIPLLVDDASLPLRVHRLQAIDLRTDYQSGIRQLVLALQQRAGV